MLSTLNDLVFSKFKEPLVLESLSSTPIMNNVNRSSCSKTVFRAAATRAQKMFYDFFNPLCTFITNETTYYHFLNFDFSPLIPSKIGKNCCETEMRPAPHFS